jgi:putative Holliday junction resolvase
MRLIGLDIGERRIGVAGNDELGFTVQPVGTIMRKNIKEDIRNILAYAQTRGAEGIVAGLPYNMNGTLGFQAERVQHFCERLKAATALPLFYFDERLTSLQAEKELISSGLSRQARRHVIDSLAAVHILEAYISNSENKPID